MSAAPADALASSSPGSLDAALASFARSLPSYFVASPAAVPSTAGFKMVLERTEKLWSATDGCDAALELGGPRAAAVKDGIVAGLKEKVLEIVSLEGEGVDEDQALYARVYEALDLTLALQSLGKLDLRAPYIVLEEAISSLSLDGCEIVFGFLELRFNELKLPFPTAQENSSGLGLIRACNALLSRLSKADDAALRGRVLGFMASAFSLSARSGVNLRGEFNTGNTTTFESAPPSDGCDREMDGVVEEPAAEEPQAKEEKEEKEEGEEEEGEEGEEKKADAVTLKEPFYETFWSIQTIFSNPSLLSTAAPAPAAAGAPVPPSTYKLFLARLTAVLKVFRKRTELERVLRGAGDGSKKRRVDSTNEEQEDFEKEADGYMPKFLTNPRLLEFELSDVGFRRQVLIQALILLHFLRSAAPSTGKPLPKIFKTKLPGFAVDGSVEAELNQAWRTAFEELDATVPGGKKFSSSLVNVLRREANWAAWKDAACPPFDLPPMPSEKLQAVASKRRRIEGQPLVPRIQYALGTPALTELWAEHEVVGLEMLENPRPSDDLKSFAMRIKRQDALMDARRKALAATAEEGSDTVATEREDDQLQSHAERKASLTFRALRQATKTSLDLFASIKPEVPSPGSPHPYVEILLSTKAAAEELEAEKATNPGRSIPAQPTSAPSVIVSADENGRPTTPTISVSKPTDKASVAVLASLTGTAATTQDALPSVEMAEAGSAPTTSPPAGSPAPTLAANVELGLTAAAPTDFVQPVEAILMATSSSTEDPQAPVETTETSPAHEPAAAA